MVPGFPGKTAWLSRPPWNNLSFRRNVFYSDTCFVRRLYFLFFVRKRWVDSSGSFGDIVMASFWCFRFSFMFTFLLAVIELKTIWSLVVCCLVDRCLVSQILFIRLFADMLQFRFIEIDRFINPLSDWIDSSIDRPIGQLIDRLVVCWRAMEVHSFGVLCWFYFSVPCAHERCDPCAFLLALRGCVELISVMVRFRSSVLFRPAWL